VTHASRLPVEETLEIIGDEGLHAICNEAVESMIECSRNGLSDDVPFGPCLLGMAQRLSMDANDLLAILDIGWRLRTVSLLPGVAK
jgi:hypothetical protein